MITKGRQHLLIRFCHNGRDSKMDLDPISCTGSRLIWGVSGPNFVHHYTHPDSRPHTLGYRKLGKPCELVKVATITAFGPSLAMLLSSYGKPL
ncbi:hypothetical protein VNO77_02008 [Canavalia gladiata]|uniref:Uncharacterized protein n=1 Tax=Canavalia gladiata TaxID=3824 RepID=A0AAN9R5Q3_CANGL